MSEQEQLARILKNCELWIFDPETAKVFANAIERRYFMDILETAGFVRTDQVLPLLRINEPQEGRISQLLQAEPKDYVFLLPLENAAQRQQIALAHSHYFILRQGGHLRFYKGGEAGK